MAGRLSWQPHSFCHRLRALVIEYLTKITHVEPSAAPWAAHEMLGIVRGFSIDPLADELAARDVTHRAIVAGSVAVG
jgi:hypothetical protein